MDIMAYFTYLCCRIRYFYWHVNLCYRGKFLRGLFVGFIRVMVFDVAKWVFAFLCLQA